jgi:hypothetical protein
VRSLLAQPVALRYAKPTTANNVMARAANIRLLIVHSTARSMGRN